MEEIRLKREQEILKQQYESKYYNSLRLLKKYNYPEKTNEIKTIDLKELYAKALENKSKTKKDLDTNIKLEYNVEIEGNETLNVYFKLGTTRMYILSNLSEFYNAYINEEEISYGKQLKLIPKRENFSDESKEIFDFIIEYMENAEVINGHYS